MIGCKGEQELVEPGKKVRLSNWNPDCMGKYENKGQASAAAKQVHTRFHPISRPEK